MIVCKKALLLTWGFAFIFTEIGGMALAHLAYSSGISKVYHTIIADVFIVIARFSLLVYIAKMSRVGLANAICMPLPNRRATALLLVVAVCTMMFDYLITTIAYGSYIPQLADYSYYASKSMLWAFPFKITYYFSEIMVMNYMYILAKKVWMITEPPITSGTIFLILGWALPHMFTKNIMVTLYAIALVLIFYSGYEYTKSPITPIILWFTVLTI